MEEVKEIEIRLGSGKSSLAHQRFLKAKGMNADDFTAAGKGGETKTELMQTREEIEKRLRGFEELTPQELDALPKNAYISYITFDVAKNRELYRPGGFLRKVQPDYIVLMGKGSSIFSVQRKIWQDPKTKETLMYNTRFFHRVPGAAKQMTGGGGAREVATDVDDDSLRSEKIRKVEEKNSVLLQKQREILEAKEREIEEMRKKLEMLEARNPSQTVPVPVPIHANVSQEDVVFEDP